MDQRESVTGKPFPWGEHGKRILATLRAEGVELDQRMQDALRMMEFDEVGSGFIIPALQKLNTRGFARLPDLRPYLDHALRPHPRTRAEAERMTAVGFLPEILNLGGDDLRRKGTLGSTEFLRLFLVHAFAKPGYNERSLAIDYMVKSFTGRGTVDLRQVPELRRKLDELRPLGDGENDYQYILALEGDRLHFRVVSHLDDYVQENGSGLWIPQRALLTHIDKLGFFTSDAIEELEDLINDRRAAELEFQRFFEKYPGFLRQLDYREVHPHVYLRRDDSDPLIPDFILTHAEAQKAAIVELKRSAALRRRIVRNQDNRVRFSDAIMEARAQLLEYRDWFDLPQNRRLVMHAVGMEIYRPRLMVIIGRLSEFTPGIERARLADRNPDLEIVTYDDILRQAKERRAIVERPPSPDL